MNANNRQITCLNQSSLKPLARCYLDNQIVGAPPLSASLWRCRTLMQREMGILNGSFFTLPISRSLSSFISLCLVLSLSHLHTLRNKVLSGFRNSETLCWIIVSDNIVDLNFHSYEHNWQEHTWACTLKNNIEICIFPCSIIPPESVIAHLYVPFTIVKVNSEFLFVAFIHSNMEIYP